MDDDGRLPVLIGTLADACADDALLIEGDRPTPAGLAVQRFVVAGIMGHPVGCACCFRRGPAAEALGRLFLARMRGEVRPFGRVVAVAATERGAAALRQALSDDPLTRARFRDA